MCFNFLHEEVSILEDFESSMAVTFELHCYYSSSIFNHIFKKICIVALIIEGVSGGIQLWNRHFWGCLSSSLMSESVASGVMLHTTTCKAASRVTQAAQEPFCPLFLSGRCYFTEWLIVFSLISHWDSLFTLAKSSCKRLDSWNWI